MLLAGSLGEGHQELYYHGVASVLVLGIALVWFRHRGVALASALLFATHPIHVEAVTSIVGRAEVLAAVFALAALLLVLWGHESSQGAVRHRGLGVGASLLFLAALLSKETALPLFIPIVVAATSLGRNDPAPAAQGSVSKGSRLLRTVSVAVPFLVATAVYFGFRMVALGGLIEGETPQIVSAEPHGL